MANINIAPTTDGSYDLNTFGQSQGDPRFGDIRVGGYTFSNSTTLAQTYFPPPNGSTAAGDLEINTSANFNINSDYDIYSVLLHEIGHSLGLEHASNPADVMYGQYQSVRPGLAAGDIIGIQSIYGARSLDTYQKAGVGLGFSTAIDVSAGLTSSASTSVSGVSLASIGSSEYFTVVAPAYASGTLQITAAAANLSMLSPKVSLYNASGTLIVQSANPNSWSDNVTVSAANVVPGQRYYVVVSGATGDYFDAGSYQLQVSLPGSSLASQTGSSGTQTSSSTTSSNSSVTSTLTLPAPDRFESNNSSAQATSLGMVTQTTVTNLSLNTSYDLDYFRFRTGNAGTYQIIATGTSIKILDMKGRLVTSGTDHLGFSAKRGANYQIMIYSPTHSVVGNYNLTIGVVKSNNSLRFYKRAWKTIPAKLTAPLDATSFASKVGTAQHQASVGIALPSAVRVNFSNGTDSVRSNAIVQPLPMILRRSFISRVVDPGHYRRPN